MNKTFHFQDPEIFGQHASKNFTHNEDLLHLIFIWSSHNVLLSGTFKIVVGFFDENLKSSNLFFLEHRVYILCIRRSRTRVNIIGSFQKKYQMKVVCPGYKKRFYMFWTKYEIILFYLISCNFFRFLYNIIYLDISRRKN